MNKVHCNDNHTLLQEHIHRVYAVILGLQFIYMSTCMQTRLYVTDMHMCLCELSCTCLVYTWVLCTRTLHHQSCMHTHTYTQVKWKMCHVECVMCLVKYKLSCTVVISAPGVKIVNKCNVIIVYCNQNPRSWTVICQYSHH